jgi:hypothetical protein
LIGPVLIGPVSSKGPLLIGLINKPSMNRAVVIEEVDGSVPQNKSVGVSY